ncbi:MAG TPA: fasciclin domain-containing protein [Propionibacteriaceae bacterium]
MIVRRIARLGCAVAVVAATALATTLPASAHTNTGGKEPGTSSLAALLAKDGSGFDKNWYDYDITDNAVAAVLAAKPNSAVAVLADGKTPVTAFLPNDRAFRRLASDLTGKSYKSESEVFTALAGKLGIDTIESVLLYHVVPGATVNYRQALRSDGAKLGTALAGSTIQVKVSFCFFVSLKDADPDAQNAYVVQPNLNKGNLQIAHGISEVMRPVDL